jgi:hypothetical protein
MATASEHCQRAKWLWRALPALLVATVAAVFTVRLAATDTRAADGERQSTSASGESAAEGEVVNVDATSLYTFATLDEMVAASDVIVVGTVAATERGRLVGDPANGGVVSRVVTVSVDEFILDRSASSDGGGTDAVRIEEEGWLVDGRSVVVNAMAPTAVGERAVWFLDRLEGDPVSTYLVINSQGRFVAEQSGTRGGDQRDALVRQLQQYPFDDVVNLVKSTAKEQR